MFRELLMSIIITAFSPPIAFADTPKTPSNKFIDGTYVDNQGITCTLDTSELSDGRIEAALTCLTKESTSHLSATWATGRIPGHPFELDLKAAGIDKIPGYANYSWGKIGTGSYALRCFYTNQIFSVRQVRKTLTLTNYGTGNAATCGVNLIRKGATTN
jgi:hypothetical protein